MNFLKLILLLFTFSVTPSLSMADQSTTEASVGAIGFNLGPGDCLCNMTGGSVGEDKERNGKKNEHGQLLIETGGQGEPKTNSVEGTN